MIGIVLTALGAYGQSWLTAMHLRRDRKKNMARYCLYLVRAIKQIARDMGSTHEKTGAIYHEFLSILDTELGVFTRNREGIIFLDKETRDEVRQFVDDITVSRSKIAASLNLFYDAHNRLLAAQQNSDQEGMNTWQRVSNQRLEEAGKSLQNVMSVSKNTDALIMKLEKIA